MPSSHKKEKGATNDTSKTAVDTATTKINYKTVPDDDKDESYFTTPEFIYGGPFITVKKASPFVDAVTPRNIPLQGTFSRSFAYFSLRDRLPVILTQIIDDLSKKGEGDAKTFLQTVVKLKNDLVTNKTYDYFTIDSREGKKWNEWIGNQANKRFFNNTWLFTECYVYRRLYEGCELNPGLKGYDYFAEKKKLSFDGNLKPMCLAAEKVVGMLTASDKEKRKADFINLLKLSLWSNKCDLSLSVGAQVSIGGPSEPDDISSAASNEPQPAGKGKGAEPHKTPTSPDPFQMILDLKDKLLVDDTVKIADQVVAKAEAMHKAIEGNTVFKYKCSCHRLAKSFGTAICEEKVAPPPAPAAEAAPGASAAPAAEAEPEAPKVPCPAKMTIPNHVMIDFVCDNAGYELFADLCLAAFLLEQKIVELIRFHVKKMPWFVSDVTVEDFNYVIQAAESANYSGEVRLPPGPDGTESIQKINSTNLNKLGKLWSSLLSSGKFVIMDEDYWTYPHPYCEMKKYDFNMYRKLQYAVALVFKGDLNYRKLLAERNVNPYTVLEPNLQGFIPAPIIALRTVKSELVCGLPKGKFEVLNNLDPLWMRTGDYGVIQFCAKAEPLKVSDRPCLDYCNTCFGIICPEHSTDM